jgi:hypothetical protein
MRHAWKIRRSIKDLDSIELEGRNNFGDLRIDGKIILRWTIKN